MDPADGRGLVAHLLKVTFHPLFFQLDQCEMDMIQPY
jgi:hypothetical protein